MPIPRSLARKPTGGVSAAFVALAALLGWPAAATAQGCSGSSPAFGVSDVLWGSSLRPTDLGQIPTLRDSTDYTGLSRPDWRWPLFSGLDIEGGYAYLSYATGIQIWDVSTPANQRDPVRLVDRNGWQGHFPVWVPGNSETREFLWDVDVPDGNPSLAAFAGLSPVGLSVWNTAVKSNPVAAYQDTGRSLYQVYTSRLGSRDYAFAAAEQSVGNGLQLYDLTAAAGFNGCVENTTLATRNCPNVYLGRLGPVEPVSFVDGTAAAGGRHLVAWSSGVPVRGVAVWDVSNPAAPFNLRGSGRFLPNDIVYGVSLWSHGGGTYLGLVRATGALQSVEIYDLTTCLTGTCSAALTGLRLWSRTIAVSSVRYFVTDSVGQGRPMLYVGSENMCAGGLQREWLFDVSNPGSPAEKGIGQVLDWPNLGGTPDPYPIDYWSWYYSKSPTGFSQVMPRMGKFSGPYLYRAAWTIFDVHELTDPLPDTGILFADGFESGDLSAWSPPTPD